MKSMVISMGAVAICGCAVFGNGFGELKEAWTEDVDLATAKVYVSNERVVTAALCKFAEDKTLPPGAYRMEIHYDRGITVTTSDETGRRRALEALKALARPDGRKGDELSFSCVEIEDGSECPADPCLDLRKERCDETKEVVK